MRYIIMLLFVLLFCSCVNNPESIGVPESERARLDYKGDSCEPGGEITIYDVRGVNLFGKGRDQKIEDIELYHHNFFIVYSPDDFGFFYNYGGLIEFKPKRIINSYTAVHDLSIDVTSIDNAHAFLHYKKDVGYDSVMRRPLIINYPKELTTDIVTVKKGDKITITSTKPFFDEASFTKDKVVNLLNYGYYIAWVSSDNKNSGNNYNPEKYPVTKEYYDIDNITQYKVVFTVPPYAKTGTIHVINEHGLSVKYSEMQQTPVRLVCNNYDNDPPELFNEVAYYSTEESITITD